jgi:hypothetical protein
VIRLSNPSYVDDLCAHFRGSGFIAKRRGSRTIEVEQSDSPNREQEVREFEMHLSVWRDEPWGHRPSRSLRRRGRRRAPRRGLGQRLAVPRRSNRKSERDEVQAEGEEDGRRDRSLRAELICGPKRPPGGATSARTGRWTSITNVYSRSRLSPTTGPPRPGKRSRSTGSPTRTSASARRGLAQRSPSSGTAGSPSLASCAT